MQPLHLKVTDIIVQHVLNGIEHVSEVQFSALVERLLSAERIFIYGAGRSGFVGHMFAMRLMHLGKQCYFVGKVTTPAIESKDLLLIISGSGQTVTGLLYAERAKALQANIVSVCLSYDDHAGEHLHQISDLCVSLNPHMEESLGDCLPHSHILPLGSGFELTALLLLESVVAVMMEEQGSIEDDLRQRHANLE